MSFRKSFSSEKRLRVNLKGSPSTLNKKSIGIFERFFNRNNSKLSTTVYTDNRSCNQYNDKESKNKFLWDLELELIYTGNVLRQQLGDLNRHNLTLQLNECARLLNKRLTESQTFIKSLVLDQEIIASIRDLLNNVTEDNKLFVEWTDSLADSGMIDQDLGRTYFMRLDESAKSFINLVKANFDEIDDEKRKRRSIDNGSLQMLNSSQDSGYKSRFSDEDREFIEKLKKMEGNMDRAPPKPQLVHADQQSIDAYLSKIENIVRAESEPIYEYSEISNAEVNQRKSVKVENNCIMATSMINNDIPTVDGEALQSTNDLTPTPDTNVVNKRILNGASDVGCSNRGSNSTVNSRRSMPERDKNMPLPPVPVINKVSKKLKNPQIPTSFHSEEHHHRKKSWSSNERSKVTNSVISNFSHRSPLRSPGFVSFINKSQVTPSPTQSLNHFTDNSVNSPTSVSQHSGESPAENHGLGKSRHILMAKQIPSIVSDPNQFLNITDMQDDIHIVSRSLNRVYDEDKREESKRLSQCSTDTSHSMPNSITEPSATGIITSTDQDGTIYNTEVKSDTEEYFEYYVINGKKYRRKMKKRTVIEKIKIQKVIDSTIQTVYAPLKPDGSGPDLAKFDGEEQDILDTEANTSKSKELCSVNERLSNCDKPVFRRHQDDRFRVCRSMFLPYPDSMKKLTLNCEAEDRVSKTPALLNNYMYRFGQCDFEVPAIDKRFSTQLLDDVNSNSAWMKTSEFNLPHEKSRSICYFKKTRQKNEDGNTVHSAFSITTSRTVKMKPPNNVIQPAQESSSQVMLPTIAICDDEDQGDDEESDFDQSSRQESSYLPSTDEEKDVDSPSSHDSLSAGQEETLSTTSTMDDSDFHDSLIDEPIDSVPDQVVRSPSPDSCFYSSGHSSYLSDTRDQYSFILKELNPNPFLIFDAEAKSGECDIAGGPVDALIVHACDGKDHLLFLGAFLDTYRTFIEPEDLIHRLIVRYKYLRSNLSIGTCDGNMNRIDSGCVDSGTDSIRLSRKSITPDDDPEKKCIHILSLLLTVIGKLKRDLNERVSTQIQVFEKYLQEINEEPWILHIKNAIKTQKQSMEKDNEMVDLLHQLSTTSQSSAQDPVTAIMGNKVNIFDLSSREIAEQMTLLDWGKYRDVELMEVLNLKDIANCKLPGVIEYAKHFHNVQYWIQSILLDPDKASSERDRYCWKFLRIMKHLRKLNNFSSLIAILLGIQLLPINKLFSKRIRSKIMEMDEYMKPTRFVGYKEDLKQAIAPCIPFLGLFYQDIVMLNIANPAYLDLDIIAQLSGQSGHNIDNFQYLSSISEQCGPIINFWRSFKQYLFLKNCNKDQDKIRYSIKPNEKILQFLNNFQVRYEEATIQRLSKEV